MLHNEAEERSELQRKLFQDLLNYEVKVHTNLTKDEIIEELVRLQALSDDFEKNKSATDILSLAIINVGFHLSFIF